MLRSRRDLSPERPGSGGGEGAEPAPAPLQDPPGSPNGSDRNAAIAHAEEPAGRPDAPDLGFTIGSPTSVRRAAHGITRRLVVPHGFTLAVSGTLAILINERGYPGALGIWLFVCGANAAFLAAIATSRLANPRGHQSVDEVGALNIAPTITVPVAYLVGGTIPNDDVAFLCGGATVVSVYVLLLSLGTSVIRNLRWRRGH